MINTKVLLVADDSLASGWRPKSTLQPPNIDLNADVIIPNPGHYRCRTPFVVPRWFIWLPFHTRRVSLKAWTILLNLYGCDGPAIAVVKPFSVRWVWKWSNSYVESSIKTECLNPYTLAEFNFYASCVQYGQPADDRSRWGIFTDPHNIDEVYCCPAFPRAPTFIPIAYANANVISLHLLLDHTFSASNRSRERQRQENSSTSRPQ